MNEFIKIKNMRGTGDMLVRISIIGAVYDKEEGGAVIEADIAGEGMKINTASTAAEVLAAIEGAQTVKGVMVDASGGSDATAYLSGDILYSTGEVAPRTRPTNTSERLGLVSREEYESEHGELTEILRTEGKRVLTKLDPNTLAVVCAGQMLARELEIRTGDKWKVTAQPMSHSFYFALEWGEFKGKTHGYGKRIFLEMEDGEMGEWAQEIAEEMVAKALRERPIGVSYSGYIRPKALDSLIGKEPAPYPLDCTCRNLISGHDPDCPWHGG